MANETIDLRTPGGRDKFTRAQGGMAPQGSDAIKQPTNRRVTKADRESLEAAFLKAWRCVAKDLEEPRRQFRFHETRRWRFDFSWCEGMIAVELMGGGFVRGGHSRGAQQEKDYEKIREANKLGWVVLQFGTKAMGNPIAVALEVAEVLRAKLQP